jgi:signal transduction histidine kinase
MSARTVATTLTSDGRAFCEILLSVTDQGIGISQDAQHRLFQPVNFVTRYSKFIL